MISAVGSPAQAAEKVYKWTDENGVVHFTATPPPDQEAERVKIKRSPRPAPAPNSTNPNSADGGPTTGTSGGGQLLAESDQPDNSAIEAENRRLLCQKGRNMITQIEPRPRVVRVDPDGTRTYLEDEERVQLLSDARDLVAENCDS